MENFDRRITQELQRERTKKEQRGKNKEERTKERTKNIGEIKKGILTSQDFRKDISAIIVGIFITRPSQLTASKRRSDY